jgi:predicted transposase YbfD/YdcC
MPKRKTVDKDYQDLTSDIDVEALQENVRAFFSKFPDPRHIERIIYPAWYIVLVILCGYLSGCNTIADIAHFAEIKNGWLNNLLGLSFRPISYDTIWWFFVRVKPEAFKNLMKEWIGALPEGMGDQLLSIDGKRLRGISDQEHISHLVELFASDLRLVIAQEKVPDKKCERTALPQLLNSIDVSRAIISMDPHYLYTETLRQVVEAGADFVVGIKGNQGKLEDEVYSYFDQGKEDNYEAEEFQCYKTIEKDHGRIETRNVCVSHNVEWLPGNEKWGFKTLVEVRSERIIKDQVQNGILYYGVSRKASPEECAKWIRGHWQIESAPQAHKEEKLCA